MNLVTKTIVISGAFGLLGTSLFAQTADDALRFGMLSPATTARSLSIGGAAGSLGADFSSASVNPAGLGVYRQSEFTITPSLRMNNNSSDYLNQNTTDDRSAFKLGNAGMVFNSSKNRSGWKSVSFALGVNKLADFNNNVTYQGNNKNSSFSEVFAASAQANGVQESAGPYGYLGYQSFLLSNDLKSVPYQRIIAQGGTLSQMKTSDMKGAVNEYVVSLGANYDDKFMVGGTIGITSYRFKRITDFIEADQTGNTNNGFDRFTFREDLQTTGVGVNGKFGFIFAPVKSFRLGAAIHTPTWSSFNDYVDYNVVANVEDGAGNRSITPQNIYQYEYSLKTPWRGILSATAFVGNKGFITADYEFVPYQTMSYKFSGNTDYQVQVNNAIKNTYRGASNVRVGAEYRVTNPFSIRAGVAYYGNPYSTQYSDFGSDRMDYSVGLGYRFANNTFIDLGYAYSNMTNKENAYVVSGLTPDVASIKTNRSIVALTLGFKF
ncbi:hypothetical protein DBR32_12185 [Taibaiella sp. KBW10]|uniref:OmpP1/FadL family transporter n=1 Tax=Taibaiella sp. KBW10 TaxID=2153357 RepID=UPI000F59229A|nr:outer membrane protein transport protein [Taibaiella sp. KBW10]RQO30323.1 hypothetical protein DBR32_12185 [Taibaiella sp. KBW10]